MNCSCSSNTYVTQKGRVRGNLYTTVTSRLILHEVSAAVSCYPEMQDEREQLHYCHHQTDAARAVPAAVRC